jgi:hypothetical protein
MGGTEVLRKMIDGLSNVSESLVGVNLIIALKEMLTLANGLGMKKVSQY